MPTYETTTNRGYQKPHPTNTLSDDVGRLRSALDAIDSDVAARAPLASPAFTGTPTAPTPAAGTNTTQIATTAFVRTEVTNLVAGAPGALDTLDELAAALGDDANFASTVTTALGNRYTKAESDARYVQGAVQTEMVFTATANQSVFTLSTPIINKPSALVTVDGVVQPTSEYSLNQTGTTLTLSEGVPAGTIVRVLALGVASAGAPADDTVTTPKLRDGAVTTAKLANGAVTTAKLANGSVIARTDTAQTFTQAQTFNAGAFDSSGNLRIIPQNSQTNSYTLVAADSGKHISITTGGVTIPSDIFSAGDAITIYNNSSSGQTITQGASTTVRQAGTANTGNRTLAQYGLATVLCVASNTFVISGAGLS